MILETEKGQENGRELDEINLQTLRGLVQSPGSPGARRTLRHR
jgi:hypothetical protein